MKLTRKGHALAGVAAGTLALALATGRPEMLAVCAAAAVTLMLAKPAPPVEVTVGMDPEAAGEGDEVRITIRASSPAPAEVTVAFTLGTRDVVRRLALTPGEAEDAVAALRFTRWGSYPLDPVAVTVTGPGGCLVAQRPHPTGRAIRVYPRAEPLRRGVPSSRTFRLAGENAARASGEGTDFLQVRPFTPGDPARRVNWRVTSRRAELHVNVRQAEKDANVVLFLDTFEEIDLGGGVTTLDLAVRAADALARFHLGRHDRVGLVGFGGIVRWLTSGMGRVQRQRIVDFLLEMRGASSAAWKDLSLMPHGALPPRAAVIAITPLVDERVIGAIADMAGRGFDPTVVNTLREDSIAARRGAELAHRVWRLQRAVTRARLAQAGVAVTDWDGSGDLAAALAALPSRRLRIRTPA